MHHRILPPLGSGQVQRSRTEKSAVPPRLTASTADNQPWDHGQDSEETLLASSDDSNNLVPKGLEIQLPKRRNDYVLYSQSFVSILGFSASLEEPLQRVTGK